MVTQISFLCKPSSLTSENIRVLRLFQKGGLDLAAEDSPAAIGAVAVYHGHFFSTCYEYFDNFFSRERSKITWPEKSGFDAVFA